MNKIISLCAILFWCLSISSVSKAQTPPSADERAQYSAFHKAVLDGDLSKVRQLVADGADIEERDDSGRTALHIATFYSHKKMFSFLVKAGSDVNAFEDDQYDVVTIAAVANDVEMLQLTLASGCNPKNTTSLYKGTALIASAHLGHTEVVDVLLKANSNVDHVNNLGWTALLEAVILGDGSSKYVKVVKSLLAFKADKNIADNQGVTPLEHARQRGYEEIIELLEK